MRYVVVGAGPAGVITAEQVRSLDPEGEITLLGGEDEEAYSRMAIPYYLTGKVPEEGTHLRRDPGHFEQLNITHRKGTRVTSINPQERRLTLNEGDSLEYDRLMLATGSRPVTPPIPGIDLPGIHPCWTLADARKIKDAAQSGHDVVLIGAGFIGTIIMDALASKKVNLTVVEAEDRICPRMMNTEGGAIIQSWCEEKGVRILVNTKVKEISDQGDKPLTLLLDNGDSIGADLVVVATGVKPILDYLDGSGIETDEGILINEKLQTNFPEIFAAGDAAQGMDYSTEGRSVHAIQPTAAEHAIVAAKNMTGHEAIYRGSLIMNVVETLKLCWYSFGLWMGSEESESAEFIDKDKHRYIRLEFKGDQLIGAIYVGQLEQIGALRGLIQNNISIRELKAELLEDPRKLMEVYLLNTAHGAGRPTMSPTRG